MAKQLHKFGRITVFHGVDKNDLHAIVDQANNLVDVRYFWQGGYVIRVYANADYYWQCHQYPLPF